MPICHKSYRRGLNTLKNTLPPININDFLICLINGNGSHIDSLLSVAKMSNLTVVETKWKVK